MKVREFGIELPLLAAGVIWGSSFVTGKIGVEHMDPVLFSLLRYVFATMSIVPLLLLFKHFDRSVMKSPIVFLIAALNTLAINMQNIGMTMTTATNTVLLVDINVVFIAILAVYVLRERMTRRLMAGLILALVGVFITSTNGDISSLGGGSMVGDLLAFGAGITWAFYVVYLTKTLKSGTAIVSGTFAIIIWTTIIQLPITLLYAPDLSTDGTGLAMALYTGVFCTTIAFTLYSFGLRSLGATKTSIALLIEIVFGMLFAVIFLSEIPTIGTVAGGLLILIAVILISVKTKKEKEVGKEVAPAQE
ncbi:MAG: DMT family transporter [Euryarchaeota archaeon]|nr:DMT family transporter [Euryarchaeota archaeon]